MKMIQHIAYAKKQRSRITSPYWALFQKIAAVVLCIVVGFALYPSVSAADNSAAENILVSIKKEIGVEFPFSKSNEVTSKRRVFGVSVSNMKSYAAYEKTTGSGNNKTEYILFVGKAKSKSAAKTAKKSLKAYVKSESESMNSYLSSSGKKIFKGAQVGCKGDSVWAVMLKSKAVNKDVIAVIRRKM